MMSQGLYEIAERSFHGLKIKRLCSPRYVAHVGACGNVLTYGCYLWGTSCIYKSPRKAGDGRPWQGGFLDAGYWD